jgi:glycosyltransferase involved in cell wall biosynthesis
MRLTAAFCTYNRADRLDQLVAALRAQQCAVPFEILAVNNNSKDDTVAVLTRLAAQGGAPLRHVTETRQGIVPARNRAIAEALDCDIMVFLDDDELPQPGFLQAAFDAITREGAQCVGGRVEVEFSPHIRPAWLEDDLLGFLAAIDYGPAAFWIKDAQTPLWTANIAYDLRLFREDASLRFDERYNRAGEGVGGGEDAMMFRSMLERGVNIRYRPDMAVAHFVEGWRLQRGYFLKLHYQAGYRQGRYRSEKYEKTLFGVPPFMFTQVLKQCRKTLAMWFSSRPGVLRQAMNVGHALGMIWGYRARQ